MWFSLLLCSVLLVVSGESLRDSTHSRVPDISQINECRYFPLPNGTYNESPTIERNITRDNLVKMRKDLNGEFDNEEEETKVEGPKETSNASTQFENSTTARTTIETDSKPDEDHASSETEITPAQTAMTKSPAIKDHTTEELDNVDYICEDEDNEVNDSSFDETTFKKSTTNTSLSKTTAASSAIGDFSFSSPPPPTTTTTTVTASKPDEDHASSEAEITQTQATTNESPASEEPMKHLPYLSSTSTSEVIEAAPGLEADSLVQEHHDQRNHNVQDVAIEVDIAEGEDEDNEDNVSSDEEEGFKDVTTSKTSTVSLASDGGTEDVQGPSEKHLAETHVGEGDEKNDDDEYDDDDGDDDDDDDDVEAASVPSVVKVNKPDFDCNASSGSNELVEGGCTFDDCPDADFHLDFGSSGSAFAVFVVTAQAVVTALLTSLAI